MSNKTTVTVKFMGEASSILKTINQIARRADTLEKSLTTASAKAEKNLIKLKTTLDTVKGGSIGFAVAAIQASKALKNIGVGSQTSSSQVNQVASTVVSATSKLTAFQSGLLSTVRGLVSFTTGLQKTAAGFAKFSSGALTVINSLRVMLQGFTNIGRSMMFFVTVPLIAFFKQLGSAAVNFEAQMTNVGRTTGLNAEAIRSLGGALREYANQTKTPISELTGVMEVLGQAGVTTANELLIYTKIFDMMAVATDSKADSVANSMIKIANAFGWNLKDAAGAVWKLGNVVSVLAKESSANADEIMKSMTDFAGVASVLGMLDGQNAKTSGTIAALGAALVSLGFSADEAGTALKNMFVKLAKNAGKISEVLREVYEGYDTIADVQDKINNNPMDVLFDLMKAARESDNNAKDLLTLMDTFDLRGGRAVAALSSNVELLTRYMQMANDEWDNATSLITDYNRAMTTTQAQLGMLKNNLSDAAITLGETLLPLINNFVQMLVPAIRSAVKWFNTFTQSQKMTAVAVALLIIVIGPLLMFIGQILHGVTLIASGFVTLGKGIFLVVGKFSEFIQALILGIARGAGFFAFLQGWPAAILAVGAAFIAVAKIFPQFGNAIANVFRKLADSAANWGTKLAASYANGFLAGAIKYIVKVVNWVANTIASFFEAHSPPTTGPLSTIDKWGVALMASYLRGFKLADFSVLSDIGKIIEQELTRGIDDDLMDSVLKKVAKAREVLAKLIDGFNKTGTISDSMIDEALNGIGYLTQDVKDLIKLWVEYNAVQQRLADLEERRKNTLKSYESAIEGIGSSSASALEKAEAIRNAMAGRDTSLREIEKEKTVLDEQASVLEEQMKWQKEMIAAVQEQADLFSRIADILDKMSDFKMGDVGFDIKAGGGNLKPDLSGIELPAFDVVLRFSKGQALWDAFVAGITGKPLEVPAEFMVNENGEAILPEEFLNVFAAGGKLAPAYTFFNETIPLWKTKITDFFGAFKMPEFKFPEIKTPEWLVTLGEALLPIKEAFTTGLIPALETLAIAWDGLMMALAPAMPMFETLGMVIGIVAGIVGKVLVFLLGAFVVGFISTITGIVTGVVNFITGIVNVISGIIQIFTGVIQFIQGLVAAVVGFIVGIFTGDFTNAINGLKTMFSGLGTVFSGIWATIAAVVQTLVGTILGYITGMVSSVISLLSNLVAKAGSAGKEFFDNLVNKIRAIPTAFNTYMNNMIQGLIAFRNRFVSVGSDLMSGLSDGIHKKVQAIISSVVGAVQSAIDAAKKLLGISSPSKVFAKIGAYTAEGFAGGVDAGERKFGGDVEASMMSLAMGFSPLDPLLAGGGTSNYNNGSTINVHRDAVRSSEDIDAIAAAVQRMLEQNARARNGY